MNISIIKFPVFNFSIAGLNSVTNIKSSKPFFTIIFKFSFIYSEVKPRTEFGSLTPGANSALIQVKSIHTADFSLISFLFSTKFDKFFYYSCISLTKNTKFKFSILLF